MSVYYRTQGFILSKNALREADQIFSIYTRDFGNLKILGKSIRKIKSKLRSGMEIFYLSEIEFIQGKNYKTLTDVLIIEKFKNIRENLDKLKIAYQIAELTDNLIHKPEKDEEIFNLLNETFNKLDTYQLTSLPTYKLIYHYFLWNLLTILGYQINLYNCVYCQKKLLPGKLYFSPQKGIICSNCKFIKVQPLKIQPSEIYIYVSPEVVKILRIFFEKDWKILLRLKMTKKYEGFLDSVSENYLNFVKNQ